MKTAELDIIFISYDEPNAELNYANLLNKAPWAKRVHGVKGSDAAHKAAANLSNTEWFITVDADNIVYDKFLDLDIEEIPNTFAYSWCGQNNVNGLKYGNGGLKIWNKAFVLNMKTHEAADANNAQVDFCWEEGYKNFPFVFSESVINHSPYQAWRAGFREGVKMVTKNGVLVPVTKVRDEVYWHNLHRLRIWSTVGSHVNNGYFAMLGARMGTYKALCTDWDYIQVRDFDALADIYKEVDEDNVIEQYVNYGDLIRRHTGFNWANFNAEQSLYITELYAEAISLGQTYYNKDPIWKNSF
jgi:hypothetical protein